MFVYGLIISSTNIVYIGKTLDTDRRYSEHVNLLKAGKHFNKFLQEAWDVGSVTHTELDVIVLFEGSEEDCILEEERLILFNYSNLFNISKNSGGGDNISYHPDNLKIREKLSKASSKMWENKTETEKLKFSESLRGEHNPNYKDGHTLKSYECFCCGNSLSKKYSIDTSKSDIMCVSCRQKKRTGINNSFFCKKHTDETKQKIRESRFGKANQVQNLLVMIDDVLYQSHTEASKSLGCSVATIRNRINSVKFPNYISVNKCQTTIESITD